MPAGTTATTDASGYYHFDGLRPGTYALSEAQPAAYSQGKNSLGSVTLTQAGQSSSNGAKGPGIDVFSGVGLAEGTASVGYNFGERGATLRGEVYLDEDTADGLPGVTVTLKDANGVVVGTTTTDAAGDYQFDNLPAGNYTSLGDRAHRRGCLLDHPALRDRHAGHARGQPARNRPDRPGLRPRPGHAPGHRLRGRQRQRSPSTRATTACAASR